MLRRPKHSTTEVVEPKEEEEGLTPHQQKKINCRKWVSNLFKVKGHTPVIVGRFASRTWKNNFQVRHPRCVQ